MPRFGATSMRNLSTCDERLQRIFKEVILGFDCTILCGTRSKELQDHYYRIGLSKLRYPFSKHNSLPSLAVDCAPWPVDWDDDRRFYLLAGYILKVADGLNIPIRLGCDWDGDMNLKDQNFHDLPHVELL